MRLNEKKEKRKKKGGDTFVYSRATVNFSVLHLVGGHVQWNVICSFVSSKLIDLHLVSFDFPTKFCPQITEGCAARGCETRSRRARRVHYRRIRKKKEFLLEDSGFIIVQGEKNLFILKFMPNHVYLYTYRRLLTSSFFFFFTNLHM